MTGIQGEDKGQSQGVLMYTKRHLKEKPWVGGVGGGVSLRL